ncbi:MAG: hypothetical protein PHC62_00035 [Candidatus Izemoplasmatales bacterium]|nr:hypothetical protein [Candidatus Izemoplasmatales bacterium]
MLKIEKVKNLEFNDLVAPSGCMESSKISITPMIPIVAQFEKISKDQWISDTGRDVKILEGIKKPKRATTGSAGYDFFAPFHIELAPGESLVIPTGIRAKINDGWVLMEFPRSGLGFKFHMTLANTVGIIDSDYYYAENEGHIFMKIINNHDDYLIIEEGDAFCQGIFIPFGITSDDYEDEKEIRKGGFGSTTKKQ